MQTSRRDFDNRRDAHELQTHGSFQAFWNAVHPDILGPDDAGLPLEHSISADWTIRFQLQLLFPR